MSARSAITGAPGSGERTISPMIPRPFAANRCGIAAPANLADETGRVCLLAAELRVLMNVTPECDEFRFGFFQVTV